MLKLLIKLKTNTSGATAIEYGLIAALIAVGLIGALTIIGDDLAGVFDTIGAAADGDPNN